MRLQAEYRQRQREGTPVIPCRFLSELVWWEEVGAFSVFIEPFGKMRDPCWEVLEVIEYE